MTRVLALALLLSACGSGSATDAGADAGTSDTGVTDTGVADATLDASPADAGPPAPPPSEPGRHDVTIAETRMIVPSDGLPPEVTPLTSNNNLDVVRHEGRVYLAWRTAPDHFAGPDTVMYMVSSADELNWDFEASFTIGTDLREPRLLSFNGHLLLYVAVLGTNRYAFEPMGVRYSERAADGTWSPLTDAGLPGRIAWRTKVEAGVPYMTAYVGGEHIYLFDGLPLSVELLTTDDGHTWRPVNAARRSVYMGGGSESDFGFADDGSLFGVIRNEAGDASGYGSEICHAPASDITNWGCHIDPKKYDSPLVFAYDHEIYLVARRNLTATGDYDLMDPAHTTLLTTVNYQTDYSAQPKRCALWRFVQSEDRIAYLMDLPSTGDTCFAAVLPLATPGDFALYNYSSDIDGPSIPWNQGQREPTFIYRHELSFTPR